MNPCALCNDSAQAQDDQGHTWYHVDYGTAEGKTVQGWLRDTHHPGTERVSPWAWAGFEIVDATGIDLADALKRNIVASGGADWKEEHDWASAVQAVDGSALFQTLQQTVGAQHYRENGHLYTNPNTGKVTPKALQTALRHPWLAQALSHLILKYESEWGGNLARWEALTPWMKEAKENWHCELQRIKALQWWDEVKGKVAGFPDSPVVYHIHPIALVGNFADTCPDVCKTDVAEFQTSEGIFRASKRAFEFILSKEDYREHPYVPYGDQSSGVTIGYGYDLGQQNAATIASELNGIFSSDQIFRLRQASRWHGDAARHLLPSISDISVSRDMALRLAVVMKRRYAQYTVDAFPGTTELHPHCQGALLSLVINRGPDLVDKPHQKTREQMRQIKADIEDNNLNNIPVQLRAMKLLWAGTGQEGLVERREQEADLFESGMTCNCWR